MFFLRYAAAELRRRKGRTLLTALGLGVGVAVVVTVSALSAGLDEAQSEVLAPLTGVGTDMAVQRPLEVTGTEGEQTFGPPGSALPPSEQRRLERENGPVRIGLDEGRLGKPGERFEDDHFVTTDLSFPGSLTRSVAEQDGVAAVASGLTLNAIHISGKVPEESGETGAVLAPPGTGAPESLDVDQSRVSGVDLTQPELGLLTAEQVERGEYFSGAGRGQAVVSVAYANENGYSVGDKISLAGEKLRIVGLSEPTPGGQSADVYVELGELQRLSDRRGRINVIAVRATSAADVAAVATRIEAVVPGSNVTTAEDLANQVTGSLVDAKDLSSKLGTALAIVALAAALAIATLLTLSSVAKRTRELGTLKALGWRQWLVVRQVTGESVAQGVLGGVLGAAMGIGAAALIGALGFSLDASLAAQQSAFGPGGPGGGPLGPAAVDPVSEVITLDAPVDAATIALAVSLAASGGLLAGAMGGLRAARLRPAEALRSVE